MDRFQSARLELLEWISQAIQVPADQIDFSRPLAEIGLDSLDSVHMIATIEGIIQRELPEDVIQRVTCLSDIFEMMSERIAAA